MSGVITRLLEHLGQRDFPFEQVGTLFGIKDPTVDSRADVVATGHQRRARR